jgi:hypothetical protein
MQPVRVYKVFLAFYSKSKCWALRASCILRAGFFLGRNGVGKYRGPRGHTLVSHIYKEKSKKTNMYNPSMEGVLASTCNYKHV